MPQNKVNKIKIGKHFYEIREYTEKEYKEISRQIEKDYVREVEEIWDEIRELEDKVNILKIEADEKMKKAKDSYDILMSNITVKKEINENETDKKSQSI